MNTPEEVTAAFTPKNKLSPGQAQHIQLITEEFKQMGLTVIGLCPQNADRGSAMRKLLDAKQAAIQAISHGVSPEDALLPPPKDVK